MRIYYIDESEGPTRYVRSALGVDAERWNALYEDIQEWRRELRERHGIPPDRELHACDLLAGRGMLARNGNANERLSPCRGAEVFRDGLRRIEDAALRIGGVEVINVCLRKPEVSAYEKVSLDRLLNRINASVKAAGTHAFLIFDEGKERMITTAYRRLRIFNPVPSRYERWEEGERTRKSPSRTSSEAHPSEAPGTTTCSRWPTSSPTPSSSRRSSPPPGRRNWAPTWPSASSTAPSTGRRRGGTPRASSGGRGIDSHRTHRLFSIPTPPARFGGRARGCRKAALAFSWDCASFASTSTSTA